MKDAFNVLAVRECLALFMFVRSLKELLASDMRSEIGVHDQNLHENYSSDLNDLSIEEIKLRSWKMQSNEHCTSIDRSQTHVPFA